MQPLMLSEPLMGLSTDLYQLTMAAGYHVAGRGDRTATFELFVRRLPARRGYLLAAGLEQALHYLAGVHFPPEAIAFLRAQPVFAAIPGSFFERLAGLRFTGDVDALPEGTPFFPGEPVLRVTAPLIQAQLVETYLLAVINYQTLVATKARRICDAAEGRSVVDFGLRRGHGPAAGLHAARAAFVGGCSGTSNVAAAMQLGIPVVGTAAHSWTMTFDRETEAFEAWARAFPEHTILLVDTYDTTRGVRRATRIDGPLKGIRLDSGDLAALAIASRAQLDAAGRGDAVIVASGDLNEYKIAELIAAGAPIDIFGVGTEMITSRDEPALGAVYKLVEVETERGVEGRVKVSPGKATHAGAKQVWRQRDGDLLGLARETHEGAPLLTPVMRGGEALALPSLREIQARAAVACAALPVGVRAATDAADYPVTISAELAALTAEVAAAMSAAGETE